MKKRYIRILFFAGSALLIFSISCGKKKAKTDEIKEQYLMKYQAATAIEIDTSNSPSKGSLNPILTIVDFADFLCPHCRHGASALEVAKKGCKNLVRVVYKHYPLDKSCNSSMRKRLHAGACELSYASYCAKEQEKFWAMHDLIFSNQKKFKKVTLDTVVQLAKKVGLDIQKFKACYSNPDTKAAIVLDVELGNRLKIRSVPTFYINNRKMDAHPMLIYHLAENLAKQSTREDKHCIR